MANRVRTDTGYNKSAIIQQTSPAVEVKEVTLELPPPHSKEQDELINGFDYWPGTRFIVGACGSKFGKTFGCAIRFCIEAWTNPNPQHRIWWVAPAYSQTDIAYQLVKSMLPHDLIQEQRADNRLILLSPDGNVRSLMEFKSGEDPDKLRGFPVRFFVLDEAARIKKDSVTSVRTTTTQTMGRGIIISTPKGRGHFYEDYQRGLSKDFKHWRSVRLPTWVNPHVEEEAILQMRQDMPDDVFRQEVAAEFLLESAGVFRNIQGCLAGFLEPPLPSHRYIMGVDLARLRDFSVITVMDVQRKHVVAYKRFKDLEWSVQYAWIAEYARMYNNAMVLMDSTGIGDPILDSLQRMGINAEGYKIGQSTSKTQLIEKLRMNIEHGRITFPEIPELVNELEMYEYQTTKNGIVTYNAPYGFHDDSVISLALCVMQADQDPFVYRYYSHRGI